MTKERWDDLVSTILDRFEVKQRGQEPLEEGPGQCEFIEFDAPTGAVRLEFVTKPVITGKHTSGGRRVGTATAVTYDYSEDEFSHSMKAYRQVDGEWEEIDAKSFLG